MGKSKVSGASEWAVKRVNCCTGCPHGCLYCFAETLALRRRQINKGQWTNQRVRQHDVNKEHPKYPGRVMFPSTHDINPTNLVACLNVLKKLLKVGNEVLIVSKPHLDCIEVICQEFGNYRESILFRFSIGAYDDSVLSFWEPNAPSYTERKACIQYAYDFGFQTSVSAEPILDSAKIDYLIVDLLPFVTDSIWIGKMNHIDESLKYANSQTQKALAQIEAEQIDAIVESIYDRHKNNPMIKWKESIKKVVGLPLAPKPGMDN